MSGATLNPSSVSASAQANATLKFSLSAKANITVCVLSAGGKVMRTVARPANPAGAVTMRYLIYHRAGHGLPAGQYTVLIVASNAGGSATAALRLTVEP